MKKFVLSLASLFLFFTITNAATITVHVANFQFTPAAVNAVVGDVIHWVWDNGSHTTTSVTIPAGAATWNANMNTTSKTFDYTITVVGTYDYHCIPHAPNMAGTITATAALPVVLSYLNVSSTAGNKAMLTWKTLSEQNTASFIIKRSTNGSSFTEIGRVKAAGNSTAEKVYSFTDNNISKDNKYYYYMLQIADKDNQLTASDIKLFRNNTAVTKLITSMSPNPISSPGHLMLQFNADKAGTMLVQLYDATGKLVKQDEMGAVEGLNNGHFHLGNLAAGIYNIVFSMDKIKETKSIVVQ